MDSSNKNGAVKPILSIIFIIIITVVFMWYFSKYQPQRLENNPLTL